VHAYVLFFIMMNNNEGNKIMNGYIWQGGFMDVEFRDSMHLGAVNSINFARVLAQIS
jgi:hypothetical protein